MGSAERILEVRDWDRQLLLEVDYAVLDHPQNYILTVNGVQVEQLLGYNAENMGARTLWSTGFDDIVWSTGLAHGVRVKAKDEPTDIRASAVVRADGPRYRGRAGIGAATKTRQYHDSFLVELVGPVP